MRYATCARRTKMIGPQSIDSYGVAAYLATTLGAAAFRSVWNGRPQRPPELRA